MSAKRGNPNWTKGKSGNPGGRKPLPLDVVSLCRAVTVEAVTKQIEIMRMDAKGDPAILGVQQRVMESMLNRGWGQAPQQVLFKGDTTIKIDWGGKVNE